MEKAEHVEKLQELLQEVEIPDRMNSSSFNSDIESFVYSMNERGVWENDMQLDKVTIIRSWMMVQYLLNNRFPEDLRM
jgi:hypothetical protein